MMLSELAPPAAGSGHRFDAERRWAASLALRFANRDGVTRLVQARHQGPLRVQRPFYPEGSQEACHVYVLHPPGGLVSGDALTIRAHIERGAHALLTTPAANKLYKADSQGVAWTQHTELTVEEGGTLEWLPQETIAFDGSKGTQRTHIALQGNARCLGWEVMALGRPASDLPYVTGRIEQHFRLTLDGQPLDPAHPRFAGRWGQGGATVQATLWAVGIDDAAVAIEALREALPDNPRWAVTVRHGVLLMRYLGTSRNEAWALCEHAWQLLRPRWIEREAHTPRIWLT